LTPRATIRSGPSGSGRCIFVLGIVAVLFLPETNGPPLPQ
jgi:hypothetical protein